MLIDDGGNNSKLYNKLTITKALVLDCRIFGSRALLCILRIIPALVVEPSWNQKSSTTTTTTIIFVVWYN